MMVNLRQVAQVMPNVDAIMEALEAMEQRLSDASLTPSAQVLAAMQAKNLSHQQLAFELAQQHQAYHLQQPLTLERRQQLNDEAGASIAAQARIEAEQSQGFDDFLAAYLSQ
jgi:glutamate--cysteine ligase